LFYNGQYLADAEDVIVVTIKFASRSIIQLHSGLINCSYRLNIFGFPGAPGIQQNVGLLDQRMALEWVRDNIAAFGGDCSRITAFGQSAGSVSIAYQAYAYPNDPIVAGYIMESGTPHSWTPLSPSLAAQHWYNASSTLGCGTSGNVLTCMQSKNVSSVLAAFAKVPVDPTAALNQPVFQPVEDNITVFHDYSALAAAGKFAKLVSHCSHKFFFCTLLIRVTFSLYSLATTTTSPAFTTFQHLPRARVSTPLSPISLTLRPSLAPQPLRLRLASPKVSQYGATGTLETLQICSSIQEAAPTTAPSSTWSSALLRTCQVYPTVRWKMQRLRIFKRHGQHLLVIQRLVSVSWAGRHTRTQAVCHIPHSEDCACTNHT